MSSLTIVKKPFLPEGIMPDGLSAAKKKYSKKKFALTYLDAEVSMLPEISLSHPDHKEWRIAQEYCKRIVDYVNQKGNNINILIAGCGNGWLAATLSKHTSGYVIGIDADKEEIKQAKRIFETVSNLQFEEGGLDTVSLLQKQFELIIMADCVEYIDELPVLLHNAFNYLSLYGEVLVVMPFVKKQYQITLESFRYNILHKPSYFFSRYSFIKNPFYHIIVKNHYL